MKMSNILKLTIIISMFSIITAFSSASIACDKGYTQCCDGISCECILDPPGCS